MPDVQSTAPEHSVNAAKAALEESPGAGVRKLQPRGDRTRIVAGSAEIGIRFDRFACLGLLGRPGEWATMRDIAFVVLDLLLVTAELVLDFVHA